MHVTVSVRPRLTPICSCASLEQLLLSKYVPQCSQDMVASFCPGWGAHLTPQRKVKIIQSTHFTYSNGRLQKCNGTCLTYLKLAVFLILSGAAGAGVDGGGGIQGGIWLWSWVSLPCGVSWEALLPLMEGIGGKGPFFRARETDAPAALGNVWDTGPVNRARELS